MWPGSCQTSFARSTCLEEMHLLIWANIRLANSMPPWYVVARAAYTQRRAGMAWPTRLCEFRSAGRKFRNQLVSQHDAGREAKGKRSGKMAVKCIFYFSPRDGDGRPGRRLKGEVPTEAVRAKLLTDLCWWILFQERIRWPVIAMLAGLGTLLRSAEMLEKVREMRLSMAMRSRKDDRKWMWPLACPALTWSILQPDIHKGTKDREWEMSDSWAGRRTTVRRSSGVGFPPEPDARPLSWWTVVQEMCELLLPAAPSCVHPSIRLSRLWSQSKLRFINIKIIFY